MKNLDIKKLLVFIAIIAVIALAVIFGSKQFFGEKSLLRKRQRKLKN